MEPDRRRRIARELLDALDAVQGLSGEADVWALYA